MKRFFLLYLLFAAGTARGQSLAEYRKASFVRNGSSLPYRILFPLHYDSAKAYPLVVFLHGSGNRGTDNESQLQHGAEFFLNDTLREKFPAIVIFPQVSKSASWSAFLPFFDTVRKKLELRFQFQEKPLAAEALVKDLVDSLVAAGRADPKRLYLGGLSLGAFGVFDMVARWPGFFAAAFPMSGGGDTAMAKTVAGKTAFWIFHGANDPLVNVQYSRDYAQALATAHADARYTEYPGVKHNSWDSAFREPGLAPWLFSKSRP